MGKGTVVVVGAGPSGIAYATKMQELGYEVKILEAEDKLGGRTRTVFFAGSEHPIGAAFNHFPKKPIPGLEMPAGRANNLSEGGMAFIAADGSDLTDQVIAFLKEGEMPSSMKVKSYAMRVAEYMHYSSAVGSDHGAIDEAAMDMQARSEEGIRFSRVQAEPYTVGAGWSRAVEKSAEKLRGKILTNARVTKIKDKGVGKGAEVTYVQEGREVTEEIDHIHVSVPASAVKHIKIEGPAEEILPALDSVVTGKASRVFFEYPKGAIAGSAIADNVYTMIDTEEFGFVVVENHQKFDGSSQSIRVILTGNAAEKADRIIDEGGNTALEEKISAIVSGKLGLPTPIAACTHSWQKVKSAEGSWPLHPNPMQRMETARIPGAVSFGGDYQPFDCQLASRGEVKLSDPVGTVHGAARSGINQAQATHKILSGKGKIVKKEQVRSGFDMLHGTGASSPWTDEYIRGLAENSLLEGGKKDGAAGPARNTFLGFMVHPNMCDDAVPSILFLVSVLIASKLASVKNSKRSRSRGVSVVKEREVVWDVGTADMSVLEFSFMVEKSTKKNVSKKEQLDVKRRLRRVLNKKKTKAAPTKSKQRVGIGGGKGKGSGHR